MVQRLQLTHFVDDRIDVLCDIRKHFEEQRLEVPGLCIVPTTSLNEYGEAWPSFKELRDARWAAQEYKLRFADNLGAVPLPPARAP